MQEPIFTYHFLNSLKLKGENNMRKITVRFKEKASSIHQQLPSSKAQDLQSGLVMDQMNDDPSLYGVFGQSGFCYMAYVPRNEAYTYIKHNFRTRVSL